LPDSPDASRNSSDGSGSDRSRLELGGVARIIGDGARNGSLMFDEIKIRELMDKVRAASSEPFVVSVSDHFAGYFDELGITVELEMGFKGSQVAELAKKLAAILLPEEVPFKWIVMFFCNGKPAHYLFHDGSFRRARD
jgi:hypothetical protein